MAVWIRLRAGLSNRETRLIRSHVRDLGLDPKPATETGDVWQVAELDPVQLQNVRLLWGIDEVEYFDGRKPLPGLRRDAEFIIPKLMLWLAVLIVLVLLAGWLPNGLGERPDLHVRPDLIRPEWYLLFLQGFFSFLPDNLSWLGVLALLGGLAVVLFWPFLETGPGQRLRERPIQAGLGLLALLALLGLTALGYYGV